MFELITERAILQSNKESIKNFDYLPEINAYLSDYIQKLLITKIPQKEITEETKILILQILSATNNNSKHRNIHLLLKNINIIIRFLMHTSGKPDDNLYNYLQNLFTHTTATEINNTVMQILKEIHLCEIIDLHKCLQNIIQPTMEDSIPVEFKKPLNIAQKKRN